MSSHHFVREGQEPALLILDPLPFSLAGPLLEWVPLVLVHQQALENVLSWGIKIDVLITSQQQNEIHLLEDQGPVERVISSDLNTTALQDALYYLVQKNYTAVTVMAALKPDWYNLPIQFPLLTISFINESCRWVYAHQAFEKWLPAHSTLLLTSSHDAITFNTDGLIEDEAKQIWITQRDGLVRITATHDFWLGEFSP